MNKHLRIEARVGELRPIAQVQLREGERLEDRVKAEIQTAAERGDLGQVTATPTCPAIAVYEVSEKGDKVDGSSIALFAMNGAEVTTRRTRIHGETDGEGKTAYLVEGVVVDESAEGDETIVNIGIFFDEEMARRISALWKAGVLD